MKQHKIAYLTCLAMFLSTPIFAKTVTITFGHSKGPEEQKIFERLIGEFEKANPGIKVKVELYASGFREKLLMQFVSGKAPDVFEAGLEDFPLYPKSGYLYPIGKLISTADLKDYPKQIIKTFSYKGSLFALTRDVAPLVFSYNKNMFAEVGIALPNNDWTWDDYTSTLKKFVMDTNGDGKPERWGFAGGKWENFVWQAGGDIYDDEVSPKKLALGSVEALNGLQFCADLANKWKVMPQSGATGWDLGLFSSGKAATSMVGYWNRLFELKKTKVDWDVAAVPKGKESATIMFSAAFAVNRVSKHPIEAYKWLQFICGPKGQREMAAMGLAVPSRLSIAKEIIPNSPPPKNGQAFIDALDYGRLAYHYGFRNPTQVINDGLVNLWNGKATAQQCIQKMSTAVNSWISRIR